MCTQHACVSVIIIIMCACMAIIIKNFADSVTLECGPVTAPVCKGASFKISCVTENQIIGSQRGLLQWTYANVIFDKDNKTGDSMVVAGVNYTLRAKYNETPQGQVFFYSTAEFYAMEDMLIECSDKESFEVCEVRVISEYNYYSYDDTLLKLAS